MRCLAAYLYAAAGQGESTTDLSWDGQTSIFENGELLAEGARFAEEPQLTIADVDLDLLRQERPGRAPSRTTAESRRAAGRYRTVEFALDPPDDDLGLRRTIERFPFVPADPERLAQDCFEAYNIQVDGLVQRLRAIHSREGGDRGLRRSGLDPRADRRGPGDGPARPAADQHPRLHHAGLRHRRRHQGATPGR